MTKEKVPTFFLFFSRTNLLLSWSPWIGMACTKRKLQMLNGCFFCAAQAPLSPLSKLIIIKKAFEKFEVLA
ncbi:hypothetical protein EUGRSUZ_D01437 [Eucalyptus grandis]|uniref:Uncharacterized protein n=2 Tax=Eucalyptus grandis TaxID=71139 RepID=A0ACC3L4R2_EUCGR|nr:hypothetical protein EUGRSUZ_D01437 [Eucalyptus grandis]